MQTDELNHVCKICRQNLGEALMSLPEFLPSLALSKTKNAKESQQHKIKFELFQCVNCGHVQQANPPAIASLKPQYAWQRFREPEEHLDQLAYTIQALRPPDSAGKVFGLSWQDTSLLQRLQTLDFNCIELNPQTDLGVPNDEKIFGIETIQNCISEIRVKIIVERIGKAQILIARDILEHAFDPKNFLKNLAGLIDDDGLLVIEVPGSKSLFKNQKHWLLWEHHTSYFFADTLRSIIESCGMKTVWEKSYDLDGGEYLIIIASKAKNAPIVSKYTVDLKLIEECQIFAKSYPQKKERIQKKIASMINEGHAVYFYGANHVGHWWLQIYQVAKYFSGIIDDSVEKIGFYEASANLEIITSRELNTKKNAVCLHLFGPSLSFKIEKKLDEFKKMGGRFLSAESFYE